MTPRHSAILAATAVMLSIAAPATAQPAGERIRGFGVAIDVASNGTLEITETIDYDFGGTERHGIIRNLVRRELYDGDKDRRYEIDVQGVTSDGASVPYTTSDDTWYRNVRIGDPDRTVTGEHRYVLRYRVVGALLPFDSFDELYWDATGTEWQVPVDQAEVTVTTPAEPTEIACYAGPQSSSLGCDAGAIDGATSRFTTADLAAYSGITVVVGIPKGVIDPPPEILFVDERTVGEAFAFTPLTAGLTGGLAFLGVAGVLLLARQGRDRRFVGSPVDAAMGNVTGEEEPVPIGRDAPGPVEFVPPDGIRPGQVGTLVDERANLVDVTATIVDLAVRGHLKITEVDGASARDYELERLDGGKGALLPYETSLLDALASEPGTTVRLSDLKYKVAAELAQVRSALYDDTVTQGWYRIRPDRTRLAWRALAIVLTLAGIGLTVLVALVSSFGYVPLAIVATGLLMLFIGGRMPARTGKGSAALSRVRGFRRLFDEGEEDTRARFAEQQGIFSQYLPYAIVFGCTDKWARAFEGLDAQQLGTAAWYTGNQAFTAIAFAGAVDHFSTTATGTLYASQPSSSSSSGFGGGGFSGGGGGGGGGSSW